MFSSNLHSSQDSFTRFTHIINTAPPPVSLSAPADVPQDASTAVCRCPITPSFRHTDQKISIVIGPSFAKADSSASAVFSIANQIPIAGVSIISSQAAALPDATLAFQLL